MLGDVEETALIPLAVRANETKRTDARIQDEKAVEIIDALNISTDKLDKLITHECVVARTILFDKTVKEYIERYPNAVCLNIGCGLDDRFHRVDNGLIKWINVDLEDAINVRKKVYEETEREKMLSGNILNVHWTDFLEKNKPVIVIAEGLFMYFSREEVKQILNIITDSFSEGILLVELMRQNMMKEKMHDTVKNTNARFGWGIDKSGKELLLLNNKLRFIKETVFSEQMKDDGFVSKILGMIIGNLNNRLSVYEWKY